MPRLPRLTAAQLLRALHRDGWLVSGQTGSHQKLRQATKTGHVVVPIHSGRVLRLETLQTVLEQAGLTLDELIVLL